MWDRHNGVGVGFPFVWSARAMGTVGKSSTAHPGCA